MNDIESAAVCCLRIEVLDSEPAIWRRFCVNPHLSLAGLHKAMAAVMGWSGEADYRFKSSPQETTYREISSSDPRVDDLDMRNLVTQTGDSFLYTYSLAKGWFHKVTVESWQAPNPDQGLAYVLEGEQACPPEFCVGIWGYEELLDRLSDPDDPDYDDLWEQVGYDFNPTWFDLRAVNQRLAAMVSIPE